MNAGTLSQVLWGLAAFLLGALAALLLEPLMFPTVPFPMPALGTSCAYHDNPAPDRPLSS